MDLDLLINTVTFRFEDLASEISDHPHSLGQDSDF